MVPQSKIYPRVTQIVTALIILIGTATIIGYLCNIHVLFGFVGAAAMNPVTAVCFILLGSWLYLYQKHPKIARRSLPVVSIFILLVGIFKLLEYNGVCVVAFDRWLFYDKINSESGFKAIAPNSALLLLITGTILINVYRRSGIILLINDVLKVTGFIVSYLAIIGYIYDLEVAYQIGTFAPLALNTAIGYLAFFTVALIETPPGHLTRVIGSSREGGRMARQAIPMILLIPLVFGYLRLLGERAGLYESAYGTALESAFMVLLVLGFVYVYASHLNIQDRRRNTAELQTAESEKKYKTLVGALREGIVYYDTSGKVLFCNESFSKITGFAEAEIQGRSIFEITREPERNNELEARLKEREAGISEVYEYNLRRRDGNNVWVSISASPVYNDRGELTGALSTIVDITERKKQIEDIEAFSASAAHDLNAPLARIEMIAMLLIESTDHQLDEENMSLLMAIAGITSNMRGLLKDLLQFSRLGISGIVKSDIDTMHLVKDEVENCRYICPATEVHINPLPRTQADKTMLRQVFCNLITNALKYSAKKDSPFVEIGSTKEGDRDVFYVKDNGAGFDMAEAHKLFAAFQRLHIEFEGHGLGLPIVKRIIEKHGGKIWAEGKPGEGATFYFTLS